MVLNKTRGECRAWDSRFQRSSLGCFENELISITLIKLATSSVTTLRSFWLGPLVALWIIGRMRYEGGMCRRFKSYVSKQLPFNILVRLIIKHNKGILMQPHSPTIITDIIFWFFISFQSFNVICPKYSTATAMPPIPQQTPPSWPTEVLAKVLKSPEDHVDYNKCYPANDNFREFRNTKASRCVDAPEGWHRIAMDPSRLWGSSRAVERGKAMQNAFPEAYVGKWITVSKRAQRLWGWCWGGGGEEAVL